ncbi:MAG: hypothetical protein ACOZNI_26045 [Myxococcota bacterium]
MPRLSLLLLASLTLFGCPPEQDEDTDKTETDADTDADTDTDTDVDTVDPQAAQGVDDGDIATEYGIVIDGSGSIAGDALDGTVTVNTTMDGATLCDLDATVTGTPYVGDCTDCDFSFEVTSTITRDDGTEDCNPYPYWSFVEDETYFNLVMTHMATYDYYGYELTDVWRTGFSYYSPYYGYYAGPYYTWSSYEYPGYGTYPDTFGVNGDDIYWGVNTSFVDQDLSGYYSYCGYSYMYYAYEAASGSGGTSTLDCEGTVVDTWTFEGVDGGTATITVDTVSADTAFDPVMIVADGDTCYIGYSDDAFDCTYPPPTYACPGAELDTEAGTYTVLVWSFGDCAGESAEYKIDIVLEGGD